MQLTPIWQKNGEQYQLTLYVSTSNFWQTWSMAGKEKYR